MARRRGRRSRSRRSRGSFRSFAKRSYRRARGVSNKLGLREVASSALVGAAVGAIAPYTVEKVAAMLPLGNWSRPAAYIATPMALGALMPSTRKYTSKMVEAEAYNIGKALTVEMLGGSTSSATSSAVKVYN